MLFQKEISVAIEYSSTCASGSVMICLKYCCYIYSCVFVIYTCGYVDGRGRGICNSDMACIIELDECAILLSLPVIWLCSLELCVVLVTGIITADVRSIFRQHSFELLLYWLK